MCFETNKRRMALLKNCWTRQDRRLAVSTTPRQRLNTGVRTSAGRVRHTHTHTLKGGTRPPWSHPTAATWTTPRRRLNHPTSSPSPVFPSRKENSFWLFPPPLLPISFLHRSTGSGGSSFCWFFYCLGDNKTFPRYFHHDKIRLGIRKIKSFGAKKGGGHPNIFISGRIRFVSLSRNEWKTNFSLAQWYNLVTFLTWIALVELWVLLSN